MKFIYTDECDIPPEKKTFYHRYSLQIVLSLIFLNFFFLIELLGLADYYLLETLKLRCVEKIRVAVSVVTVIDFLQAALDYNSKLKKNTIY